MKEIIFSTYPACTAQDPQLETCIRTLQQQINTAKKTAKTPDYIQKLEQQLQQMEQQKIPFLADAIISNPPTFGHIHCAEALEIPLHMFFTMPWTPTVEFCHPMATTLAGLPVENFLSYKVMANITWIGLRPIINSFRKNILNLKPIQTGENGGDLLDTNEIPFSYTWSPTLVARPKDWHRNCDVVGFFHKKGNPNAPVPSYAKDRQRIETFLNAGEPPIFFGFGSCTLGKSTIDVVLLDGTTKIVQFTDAVLSLSENKWNGTALTTEHFQKENLHRMTAETCRKVLQVQEEEAKGVDFFLNLTNYIVGAIQKTKRRAILQKGWGGLGYDKNGRAVKLPDSILAIGPEAHTWLFERVAAVVHHGGAGTCAAGLLAGRPTMVCSFCLDQPFWGAAIDRHGFGAPTKPVRKVTEGDLINAIENYFFNDEVMQNCKQAAIDMGLEDGVGEGLKSFHKHLRRYYKENKKFGIHYSRNPCAGLWQGFLAGASLILFAMIQVLCLPFLVVSSMSEKIAEGFRFGEFVEDEKRYDEIEGVVDGCWEGGKSCWYAVRSAFVWDSESGTTMSSKVFGVVTKPIGGVVDFLGKLCEGGLRTCRVRHGRYRGKVARTVVKQESVKKMMLKATTAELDGIKEE